MLEDNKISLGIIGSGWRAECYLQVAAQLPHLFNVTGIVSRRENKRIELQNRWNLKTYSSTDELLNDSQPNFVISAVAKESASSVIKELISKDIPVLAETPPSTTIEGLQEIYSLSNNSKIQVAEQFHLQPMHVARLKLVQSGIFGQTNYAHISISHEYHGMSLIRKYLNKSFENAVVTAQEFHFPVIEGPGRNGLPENERIKNQKHIIALINYGDKVGQYDFETFQHRSWIRSQRVLLRGEKGEINNKTVKYLKDFQTPIEYKLKRTDAGHGENLEGYYLKGILAGENWIYKNPFIPGRLSDEEIALAQCMIKMQEYIDIGKSFYSLAEACQDQYLALKMIEAINKNSSIKTETQIWAE